MLFASPGKENTEHALRAGFERGRELDINEVVVASTSGETGLLALDIFAGFRVTVVTYHAGFKEPFLPIMPEAKRAELTGKGARVISASHALSGAERGLSKKHAGVYPVLLVADTLKLFGQGTKVAVEVALMAADAGALSGRDIVAVGGSSRGADTALVLKPAHCSTLFDLRIREIVCKPRTW
ncbi:MAG: hypothetical protein LJE65_05130 [Desulfobacteraceae bacterium]|nr:hypothetical protein [Desulfobacteraceae bacterium]